MKSRTARNILIAAVAVGALTVGTAAPASASGAPAGSIVDVAVAASGGGTPDTNSRDYDILVQALIATDLAPVLADTSTNFTVFAPNDQAFKFLVRDLTGTFPASEAEALTTITTALTVEQISNVLLGHVVAGQKLGPIRVITAGSLTTANGNVLRPRLIVLQDQNPAFQNPVLLPSGLNIQASNGVIHTINRVILPAVI